MTQLEALQKQDESLTRPELAAFRRCFEEFDSDAWDAHIEADIKAGKLEAPVLEALDEYRAGKKPTPAVR